MTFKKLQEEIVKTRRLFEKKYKTNNTTGKYASLKAMEELGEFIKVMLVYENEVTDLKKSKGEERIEYTSLINIRPNDNNRSMLIENEETKNKIKNIIERLILNKDEQMA